MNIRLIKRIEIFARPLPYIVARTLCGTAPLLRPLVYGLYMVPLLHPLPFPFLHQVCMAEQTIRNIYGLYLSSPSLTI